MEEEVKPKKRELKKADMEQDSKKVKVLFSKGSAHEGEILEIDSHLALRLEEKQKLRILKTK